MHDCKGRALQVGDTILVPCKIVSATINDEYCNVSGESVASMYPGTYKTTLTVNAKQVIRANEGDETAYEVVANADGSTAIR